MKFAQQVSRSVPSAYATCHRTHPPCRLQMAISLIRLCTQTWPLHLDPKLPCHVLCSFIMNYYMEPKVDSVHCDLTRQLRLCVKTPDYRKRQPSASSMIGQCQKRKLKSEPEWGQLDMSVSRDGIYNYTVNYRAREQACTTHSTQSPDPESRRC